MTTIAVLASTPWLGTQVGGRQLRKHGTAFVFASHLARISLLAQAGLGHGLAAPAHASAPLPVPRHITPDYAMLQDYRSGLCLLERRSAAAAGTPATQGGCANDPALGWQAVRGFAGADYFLRNDESQQCLAVRGDSTVSGAAIIAQPCAPGNPPMAQRFAVIQARDGAGRIWELVQSVRSGYCVTIAGGSDDDGARAVQGSCQTRSAWFTWASPGPPG
jgi:hypothetical protein